jgi:hypothetical protein
MAQYIMVKMVEVDWQSTPDRITEIKASGSSLLTRLKMQLAQIQATRSPGIVLSIGSETLDVRSAFKNGLANSDRVYPRGNGINCANSMREPPETARLSHP